MNDPRETPDHPLVRASLGCPFCRKQKDAGLVACWACFRSTGLRNGEPHAEYTLDLAEAKLASDARFDDPNRVCAP